MMPRFTLIHDGTPQGWQAAYLALHVAARLGAPLTVALIDPVTDENILLQRAAQVGVGGRAAGVSIEAHLIDNFSVDALKEIVGTVDGLFIPDHLVPDKETAERFLIALSCPVWIVSKQTEMYHIVVLVNDLTRDAALIDYTSTLSARMQQSLTGLVRASKLETAAKTKASLTWFPLQNFTSEEIAAAINHLSIGLTFIPFSELDLVTDLKINFVIFPDQNA